MTGQRKNMLRDKIRRSRARLMVKDPAFAMVLMYLSYVATKEVYRISTDGRVIYFDPDWFQKLGKTETDYILSHQVLHIVHRDTKRPNFFRGDRYHHACDIIIGSVLRSRGWDCEKLGHIGILPHRTYFPGHEGNELEPLEAYREVPFDPSALPTSQRRRYRIDSDEFWGRTEPPADGTLILGPGFDRGPGDTDEEGAKKSRKLKVVFASPSTDLLLSGKYLPGTEDDAASAETGDSVDFNAKPESSMNPLTEMPDTAETDSSPTASDGDDTLEALDAAIDRLLAMIEEMEGDSPQQSKLLERIWKGVGSAKLEWRRLLNAFLQEEVNDYSFTPPDRRFDDSGFFLPDFNLTESTMKEVLFMVDSSGSVSDELIADVYGEICSAIEQFGGVLRGRLGFFDTQVVTPVPFGSIHQLLRIRPKGHGGTDLGCVFSYIRRSCDVLPSCIVIFTDGMGEYPPEKEAMGIPVIWIIHGDAPFPDWGKKARIRK